MPKKMGRPTDSPKTTQFSLRLNKEQTKMLDDYCARHNLKRVEAIRKAIRVISEKE